MSRTRKCLIAGAIVALTAAPALAQKSGGTLRMHFADNPPGSLIHQEATTSAVAPFMSLYDGSRFEDVWLDE